MSFNIEDFDWSGYSFNELNQISISLNREIGHRREDRRKTLLEQIQELVSSEGFSLDDVVGGRHRGKQGKRGPAPVKYIDPETGKGWSGRGRKPVWLVAKLEKGMDIEDFAVETPEEETPEETAPAMYRDPETGKEWNGKGRKPAWVNRKLKDGMQLEDFAVERAPGEAPEEEPAAG
jgi:DNA-binding protein H-NS